MSAPPAADRLHWETTLDRLELDTILVERHLEDRTRPLPEPWHVPAIASPLPADLVGRAREIAARQQQARAALAGAVHDVQRERAFAARVSDATRLRQVPVYLDVQA